MAAASLWARVQSVCHQMARKGHAKPAVFKRGKVVKPGEASQDLRDACALLGRGDEAEMKAFLLSKMDEGYDTLSGAY
jgi:hypothetical protein